MDVVSHCAIKVLVGIQSTNRQRIWNKAYSEHLDQRQVRTRPCEVVIKLRSNQFQELKKTM